MEEEYDPKDTSLLSLAVQYLRFRKGREAMQKNEDSLKKTVMNILDESGESDEKGNKFFHFPDPIDGVSGVKRERRVSQTIDEDFAMELIEKYQLADKYNCLETVVVLNEDGLLAANFDGIIPDSEMAKLYSEKESFAFVLIKEKN